MHIGFDAKRAFLNVTGLGNYSRYTINSLCRLYPENKYSLYTTGVNNSINYAAPENSRTVLPGTIWSKNLKSYWRSIGIVGTLKKDRVDLFHGLSNEIPLNLEKSGIRSVVTMHDLIFLRLPDLYKPLDRRIYLNKSRSAVRSADRIIAISKQTKQDLVELLGADEKKIRIIYQGCNPWFYEKTEPPFNKEIKLKYELPENYLLYVGTIEQRKNLLNILKALHLLDMKIPLIAIGRKTDYFNEVKQFIAENRISDVRFFHHIENRDLPAIYQSATAFVYPSSYEGFGIPVLEALNSGIPVITSKGGCLEETAGEGGLLVTPGNIEELAEAISMVIHDSELRSRMIQAGLKHALRFREENTIPDLIEVYNECMI